MFGELGESSRESMLCAKSPVDSYLHALNIRADLRPPPDEDEMEGLDIAVSCALEDPDTARQLSNNFLLKFISPTEFQPKTIKSARKTPSLEHLSRRKRRKVEHATLQRLYKKSRHAAYQQVFSKTSTDASLTSLDVFGFWSHLLSRQTFTDQPFGPPPADPEFQAFITPEEVDDSPLHRTTAEGPDGVSVSTMMKIPIRARAKLFTCWLLLGWAPSFLTDSRTIFLPKKDGASAPSDLRPISIPSVLLRQFHKILARRVSSSCPVDPHQFGFQRIDGVAKGIKLLNNALRAAANDLQPLAFGVLDLQKAFDSVSHASILSSLQRRGVSTTLIRYLHFVYSSSKTFLSFQGSVSEPVRPTRGVRQGDPLSPVLFLLVMDEALQQIPKELGFQSPTCPQLTHLAYADDLVLLAKDRRGLQAQLDIVAPLLAARGLLINRDKCFSCTWLKDGKNKRMIFDNRRPVYVDDRPLPCAEVDTTFKYLGATFTTSGLRPFQCRSYASALQQLANSKFRPQQKVFFLTKFLMPAFLHQLTFSKIFAGRLRKLDVLTRDCVRRILHLPHDVPTSLYHADCKDGGLGVPSLRWLVPVLANNRGVPISSSLMKDGATLINSSARISTLWRNRLRVTTDGIGLKQAPKVPQAHTWILDGTRLLTGREYISAIHTRLGVLYSRSRATRGRPSQDRRCSRGCGQPETLNHIVQSCYATHGFRIKRHDHLCNYIGRALTNKGYSVQQEPTFTVNGDVLKPDLVAYSPAITVVVDCQVTNDQFQLDIAHRNKKLKYQPLTEQLAGLRPGGVLITSFTTSWRGCIAKDSVSDLVGLGVLRKTELKVLSVRTLCSTANIWNKFSRMTTCKRRVKQGVG